MKVSIILPTLNEEKNILKIVRSIKKNVKSLKNEIIFVDDNSSDNTQREIIKVKKNFKNIRCIFRKKRNLSTAFIEGLKISKGNLIVLMDSDLQHDPKNIKKSITKIQKKNFDMIIGSRFLKGSKNYKSSIKSWFRLFLSKSFINIFNLIFFSNISDPLSGFFVVKRSKIIGKEKFLYKKGFKIVMDYYLLLKNKIKITEIPINLNKRQYGQSKLNLKILILIIKQVIFYIKK
tara:strand:- start:152 stop:850 length:699 start_codon:yes stop_codon:yes gene_type:complete